MNKLRLKFSKNGPIKFIGHLDLMRYFQKAIRRADIDIKYSEGFSPHQVLSFAQPLSVGATSDGEYLDMTVNSMVSAQDIMDRLNSIAFPELRNTLLARFAPEIVRGRERSMKLVARYAKKLAKAREIDARREALKERRNGRISLKPKTKNNSNEHDEKDFSRKKSSVADGYPY